MPDYPPGTVAKGRINGKDVRLIRLDSDGGWYTVSRGRVGYAYDSDREVTDIRPLVVLDLEEDNPQVDPRVVVRQLREAGFFHMARQIEAQTWKPRPPEPTGLGAVVRDSEGHTWVLCLNKNSHGHWYSDEGIRRDDFSRIPDPEVLSEGWSEA